MDVIEKVWKSPGESGHMSSAPRHRPRVHLESALQKHGPATGLNAVFKVFISRNEKRWELSIVESIYFYKIFNVRLLL